MENRIIKLVYTFIMLLIVSCDEPETVVTNIIHTDGSITRKLEMKNSKNNFKISDMQVPFDSTWTIADSIEFSDKGDTTWIIRAQKWFADAEELNLSYKSDSGKNRNVSRYADFRKKFRWFNTIYRFSETIGRTFLYGPPAENFMNDEELYWFYSPVNDTQIKLGGPDSLKYKALADTVEKRKEEWFFSTIVSEWAGEFSKLFYRENEGMINQDTLTIWERRILKTLRTNDNDFDSLWQSGFVLRECIGESNALRYKVEADSALKIVEDRLMIPFDDYTMRILMPGNLTSSNGFADSSHTLTWPVMSDYSFTEDYVMWAESRVPNIWAWILSGIFLLFVLTGITMRRIKKG